MDTEYYVVVVQDIGERLEYEYTDYDKAVHLMEAEALPCSLWVCLSLIHISEPTRPY